LNGSSFGRVFKITTFGESHGPAVGVIVEGVPAGLPLSSGDIQRDLDRRRPGQSRVTTPREEADQGEILSGVFEGKTTGTPIGILIRNRDSKPEAYETLRDVFRPGHADYTYWKKYGIRDHRGGGRSSGRETAARVAGGAVARAFLAQKGIKATAYTLRAAGISCRVFDEAAIESNPLRACDPEAAALMEKRILELSKAGNSAGGIVECRVTGVPAGLGEPVFGKLDALIAAAVLSIGAIKGIEFGRGFEGADLTGKDFNDPIDSSGFLSNNSGGVLGGISSGQEILFRAAVKPTPTLGIEQSTVDKEGKTTLISVKGRHDPCICPRVVPVVEAMTLLVLADLYILGLGSRM